MNITKSVLIAGVAGLLAGESHGEVYGYTTVISLPDMAGPEGATFDLTLEYDDAVVGISWGGDWFGTSFGWPNDWALYSVAPDGTKHDIPSYSFGPAGYTWEVPVYDIETYSLWFKDAPVVVDGEWSFTFVDIFESQTGEWTDLHVTMYHVPSPGALLPLLCLIA